MNLNDLFQRIVASPFILAGGALLLAGGRAMQPLGVLVLGFGVFQTFSGTAEAATTSGSLPTFGGGTTDVFEEGSIDQIFLPGGGVL